MDGALTPVGKLDAHVRGLRHKAVSVFVTRGDAVLIQRRAAGKYHSGGLWANTCCTHPHWGEPGTACAARRLREELGIGGLSVAPRPTIEYRADVGGGLTEHEVVEVFTAEAGDALPLAPAPAEVEDVAWIDVGDLRRDVAARPDRYTAWMRIYMRDHLGDILGR